MEQELNSIVSPILISAEISSYILLDKYNRKLYITAHNKDNITLDFTKLDIEYKSKIIDIVTNEITKLKKKIIYITNAHIFIPKVLIKIVDNENKLIDKFAIIINKPIGFQRWISQDEHINFNTRLNSDLNWDLFDKFMDKTIRYKRAFNYYIKSFEITDTSVAFSLLCTCLDCITGKSNGKKTKERLAKYSSILLCEPKNIEKNKKQISNFYRLRSDFIHGRKNNIQISDEVKLREYVHRFLIAYYLFSTELKVKNDYELLQHLDNFNEYTSLYMKKHLLHMFLFQH